MSCKRLISAMGIFSALIAGFCKWLQIAALRTSFIEKHVEKTICRTTFSPCMNHLEYSIIYSSTNSLLGRLQDFNQFCSRTKCGLVTLAAPEHNIDGSFHFCIWYLLGSFTFHHPLGKLVLFIKICSSSSSGGSFSVSPE